MGKYHTKLYLPGEVVILSGQYRIVNIRGEDTRKEKTLKRGEYFPRLKTGEKYILLRKTK